jgi:hypothetical protein
LDETDFLSLRLPRELKKTGVSPALVKFIWFVRGGLIGEKTVG